ncbi:MAG: transcriptional regulator LeuO [Halioglobus sp.]
MSLRRVDLNLLTVFDAIYSEGNLTQAAARIGMSQPAMSNALNRIRHLIGDDLFVREGRGIKPTARADELAPSIRQALGLVEGALQLPDQFDPMRHERFCIGGFDYSEIVVLPRLMQLLKQRAPQLHLRFLTGTSTELAKPLRYGEVDVVIDYITLGKSGYFWEPLFSEDLVVMSKRGHPAIGDTLDLETFIAQRFVFREDRSDEPTPEIDVLLEAMGRKRNIALSVTNWLAMPEIVAESELICTCPKLFADIYANQYDLQVHRLPLSIQPIPIYMIWHESKDKHPAHRWLRAQLKRACRNISRPHAPATA